MQVVKSGILLCFLIVCVVGQTPDERLRSGKQYVDQERWREAEEQFRLAVKERPDSAEAVTFHARSLMAIGQPFDAAIELEEFLKRSPDSVPVLKLYGHLLDAVVLDKAKAEEVLTRCAKLAPRDPDVWRSLGALYLVRNRFDDSVKNYREAVRLSPNNPLLIASLAYAESKTAPSPKINASFLRSVRLNKSSRRPDPAVHLLYGDYLLQTGKIETGVAQLTSALLIDPHLAEAYFLRAAAYERLKKYPLAEVDALAAIRENEKRKDAHQLLLRVYRATNNEAKAQAQASILQKMSDEGSKEEAVGRDIRQLLATAEPLLREGKFAEAARAYEEIVRASPDFYEGYFALGVSYFQLGNAAASETALKKYLSFQPISADGRSALGVLLFQQSRFAEARTEFQKAVEIDPSAVEARKGLAQCALVAGDANASAAALEPLYQQGDGCDPECYVLLAKARLSQNQTERVVEILNRGLKQHAQSVEYLKSLTQLMLDERPRGAQTRTFVEMLRQTLPKDSESYYYSGLLELLNSRPEQAILEANNGLAIASDDASRARLQSIIGRAEEKLGDFDRAEAAYRVARAANKKLHAQNIPIDFHSATHYAQFLAHRSRNEEALSLLTEIIAESPNAGVAYLERAKLIFARRSYEQAIADGNLALQHAGLDLETIRAAHTLLIRAYYAAGKKNDALAHQRQLQALK
jgi:tetratricopeptide (TPR) repeat protein